VRQRCGYPRAPLRASRRRGRSLSSMYGSSSRRSAATLARAATVAEPARSARRLRRPIRVRRDAVPVSPGCRHAEAARLRGSKLTSIFYTWSGSFSCTSHHYCSHWPRCPVSVSRPPFEPRSARLRRRLPRRAPPPQYRTSGCCRYREAATFVISEATGPGRDTA
jgi:hypothetical protein